MVPYILAENPDINTNEALARSEEMMMGNKWKSFVFDLSFIGWHLLSVITGGIVGIFWTFPYVLAATRNYTGCSQASPEMTIGLELIALEDMTVPKVLADVPSMPARTVSH